MCNTKFEAVIFNNITFTSQISVSVPKMKGIYCSTDTVYFQLGWVCDKAALPTIAQAVFFGGAILGGLIFGWMADRYGRIPALVWTNLIGFTAGIATAFVSTFWAFCLCRFLVGLAFDNCFTMMYILGKYLLLHSTTIDSRSQLSG
jgi:MFS family permease